jgi:hypothetical protein
MLKRPDERPRYKNFVSAALAMVAVCGVLVPGGALAAPRSAAHRGRAAHTAAMRCRDTATNGRHRRRQGRQPARCHRPVASAAIVGGTALISAAEAPWAVLVEASLKSTLGVCSGAIIDASHILTAAHCTVSDTFGPWPVSSYTVTAGIVDATGSGDQSHMQSRGVEALRTAPGWISGQLGDDVAELTLSEPLDLSGAFVSRVQVAASGAELPVGSPATLYGWGTSGSPEQLEWHERALVTTLNPSYYCASGLPSLTCVDSNFGEACGGDSGGGYVTPTSPPILVAVEDFGARPCAAGKSDGATSLSSPEIQLWLAGDGAPVLAPRSSSYSTMSGDQNAGGTVECSSPAWSLLATLSYLFIDTNTFAVLQEGPASYVLRQGDVGRSVGCVTKATTAGGFATSSTARSITVLPGVVPALSLRLTRSSAWRASAAYDISPRLTLHLSVSDRSGRVLFRRAFVGGFVNVALPRLSPGSYSVCVGSDPLGIYTAASTCEPWTVAGRASALLRLIRRAHVRAHWSLRFRTAGALVGHRVRISWKVSRCAGCLRHASRTITLHSTTTLSSPTLPLGMTATLSIVLPTVTVSGVPYTASVYRWRGRG